MYARISLRTRPGAAALTGLIRALRDLPAGSDGAVLIDQIRALEELKSAAAATQAHAVLQAGKTSEYWGSPRQ
jgi:hypothetical protein